MNLPADRILIGVRTLTLETICLFLNIYTYTLNMHLVSFKQDARDIICIYVYMLLRWKITEFKHGLKSKFFWEISKKILAKKGGNRFSSTPLTLLYSILPRIKVTKWLRSSREILYCRILPTSCDIFQFYENWHFTGGSSFALFELVTLKFYLKKRISNLNFRGTLSAHLTYLYFCTVHLVDSLNITLPTNALSVYHLF